MNLAAPLRQLLRGALAAMLVATPVRAYAAPSPPIALPDCTGVPQSKPASVVLTCADAGVSVSGITWTGWGELIAAGAGVASVNDCDPSCAAGHFHRYRVVLLASGRERCPAGRRAYARVTAAWIGRSPYAHDPSEPPFVIDFPCGPRR